MPARNRPLPTQQSLTADGANRPLEGMYFLWLEGQRVYACGRITSHMTYNHLIVEFLDPDTLETMWFGSMCLTTETVMVKRWLLFYTEIALANAISHIRAVTSLERK